ncbi:hypothetical protein RRF57_012328 [Xylaria bambusicola]|uniref:Uncharacterized protein n=1 Tax=Xylaria bambusicola TaxID=326684 RepID=A0AAN7ZAV4_9PEZI
MQKTYNTAREEDRPHARKTPKVAPADEIRMQVVAGSRSVNVPITRAPIVVAMLMRSTVSAARKPEAPSTVRAYVGR